MNEPIQQYNCFFGCENEQLILSQQIVIEKMRKVFNEYHQITAHDGWYADLVDKVKALNPTLDLLEAERKRVREETIKEWSK